MQPYNFKETLRKSEIRTDKFLKEFQGDNINLFWGDYFNKYHGQFRFVSYDTYFVKKNFTEVTTEDSQRLWLIKIERIDKEINASFYFKKDNNSWILEGIGLSGIDISE
jgi:hypothetical protein